MPLPNIARGRLSDLAVEGLRDQLAAGAWAVGERLPPEAALASDLGVGRSTLREAVRVLVDAGQLETRQGSGTFVRALEPPPEWEARVRRAAVLDVYEVREALEVQAARLAALRRTDEDLEAIDAALAGREARRGVLGEPFVDADLAFHAAVVAAARNPLLQEMFDSFLTVLRAALVEVVRDVAIDEVDTADAHAQLAAAIRDRDPEAAAAATHANVSVTARGLRELVDAAPATPRSPRS
ncbi:FadR/GntR family transcriptional regulator [Patulibacter sp. S7RM1-6]